MASDSDLLRGGVERSTVWEDLGPCRSSGMTKVNQLRSTAVTSASSRSASLLLERPGQGGEEGGQRRPLGLNRALWYNPYVPLQPSRVGRWEQLCLVLVLLGLQVGLCHPCSRGCFWTILPLPYKASLCASCPQLSLRVTCYLSLRQAPRPPGHAAPGP